LRDGCQLGCQG